MKLEEIRKSAHSLELDNIFKSLETSEKGLPIQEAERRFEEFGSNEITDRNGPRTWSILIKQFQSPLIFILVIAGVISLLIRDYINAGVIFGAVVLNTIIGFTQELKVSNILEELKKVVSYTTEVLRDGERRSLDSKKLVVGDIIHIKQGQKIPADARLISLNDFKTNEAVFTGESTPVEKNLKIADLDTPIADRKNMVFLGTYAEQGSALAVVVATGGDTELGKITKLIQVERKRDITPLEIRLKSLAKILGWVFVVVSVAIFGLGVAGGRDLFTMFITSIALAVSAIPEGLPVALSVILAVGARHILDKGGLVRKMVAAEALGNTTVIASDKTATLTEGKMTLTHVVDQDVNELDIKNTPQNIFNLLILNTNAFVENRKQPREKWEVVGKAMDKAIVVAGLKQGIDQKELEKKHPRIDEIPFSARYKYSAVINEIEGRKVFSVLGAPEVILEMTALDLEQKRMVQEKLNKLAANGFRILALASKETEKDSAEHEDLKGLRFDALATFSDPIRKDVKGAIETASEAGLRTIVVTGDHLLTAKYVSTQLGILKSEERIIEGKNLGDVADLPSKLDRYDVFARVSPDEKVRIVKAFEEKDERVAVIGDGINDAPALLRADIGVAVGSGTDVAKEASDLVLLNDSFAIIVEAIRQGRIILDNIKKVIIFLLSQAFSEMLLIVGSIVSGLPLAILPAQILWINLIEDGLPAISLAFEGDQDDVMKRKPEKNVNIFNKKMRSLVIMFTIVTNAVLFGLFYYFIQTESVEYTRTMIFLGLGVTSLFYIYSVRTLSHPFWKISILSNHFLNFAVAVGFILYFAAVYFRPLGNILDTVPLALSDWIILLGLGLFNIAVIEVGKKVFMRK